MTFKRQIINRSMLGKATRTKQKSGKLSSAMHAWESSPHNKDLAPLSARSMTCCGTGAMGVAYDAQMQALYWLYHDNDFIRQVQACHHLVFRVAPTQAL